MSSEAIEQRLTEFVAESDEPDWDGVLARAGTPRRRLPRGPALVLAGSVAVALLAAYLAGAFSRPQTLIAPGGHPPSGVARRPPGYDPLNLQFTRGSGGITSIAVTVQAAALGGTAEVQVLRGIQTNRLGGRVVFQETVPMTEIAVPASGPSGTVALSTWSGSLSPSDWEGGCQDAPYAISIQVTPAPTGYENGESSESQIFNCAAP